MIDPPRAELVARPNQRPHDIATASAAPGRLASAVVGYSVEQRHMVDDARAHGKDRPIERGSIPATAMR